MAANSISFSGRAPRQTMCLKTKTVPAIGSLPFTTHFDQHHKMETLQHSICMGRQTENKAMLYHRKLFPVMASPNKSWSFTNSSPLSASDTVKEFYICINKKKLTQLGNYISADCQIDECSFLTPFQGKKEVMQFFDQLIVSMGQNVKFNVKHVCEGDDQLTAAANWHLEFKKEQIPFTRGCSVFEFTKEREKIIIKKAQIMIESPIKPGILVLTLLKTVTSIFDNFPTTAQWFLKRSYEILQWILKIHSMSFTIFINPFLEGYFRIWKYPTKLLGYAFKVVVFVSKFLKKE